MIAHFLKRVTITLCGALSALGLSTASAVTAEIQPSMDNTIYQGVDPVTAENFELNSCGAGTNLFAGVTNDGLLRRALLKFDIVQPNGPLPAGSTINSVTLHIDVNRSGDNQDAPMTLRPLTQTWGEGTADCDAVRGGGQGIPANPGDATWLDAMFQQVLWSSAGGDFGAASASALIGTGGESVWSGSGAANPLVQDVQGWLDNPGGNFGWMVVGDEARSSTTRRFESREGGTGTFLEVDYTPVGDVFACCFEDGGCQALLVDNGPTVCTDAGGIAFENEPACSPNPCPQPTGACCNLDESCSDSVARDVCEAGGGTFQGDQTACSDNQVDCGLTPFVDPLPIPGVVPPVSTRPDGVPQYEITMTEERQQLHRDLPDTDVWTYNGAYPGPTLEAVVGQPIEVKYINDLPTGGKRGGHILQVDTCPHGPNYWRETARTVAHLHGGHTPARSDGLPEYDFMPGEFDVYEYPNNQLPATLWYHDHALGITRLNVYAGLAAYYILRDDYENNLGLPAGEFEIPAVIQDRSFFDNGELYYPPTLTNSFFGDKVLVNGKVWPYLNVKRGKYRFRFLNGSQARQYRLRLENPADPGQVIPFTLIGTDGGLISAPLNVDTILAAPAERFDVVIDFAGFDPGTQIVLHNDNQAAPLLPNVMKFIVTDESGFTGMLPANLRAVPAIPENQATVTRRFLLEKQNDNGCSGTEWLVKSLDAQRNVIGEQWDDISEFPILGETEIWEFENPDNQQMHPMHVHLVQFQVLEREDMDNPGQMLPLEPWEMTTWKDTVRVPPRTITRVIMKFEDYPGKFPYHCHILDHEDHEMMRQFQASFDPANCNHNGTCDPGEDCVSCASDCGTVSGASCGNGLCEIGDGEDCVSCPQDCAGKQKGSQNKQFCCGDGDGNNPVANCGFAADGYTIADNRCFEDGFFCRVAARVPACCGDSLCEGGESDSNCAVDCAADGGGADCSAYPNKQECKDDPACMWDNQTDTCVDNN
jgi:spore coat protein A, manganese oxidase